MSGRRLKLPLGGVLAKPTYRRLPQSKKKAMRFTGLAVAGTKAPQAQKEDAGRGFSEEGARAGDSQEAGGSEGAARWDAVKKRRAIW